jgi:AraC-like DNA-binding protein
MIYYSIINSNVKDVLQKSADHYEPRGRLDPTGFDHHVSFRTYLPPVDLKPFIEHFWIISWEGLNDAYNSEEVMHRPYVDVFFSAEQVGVQGTFRGKRTYVAAGTGRIVGIRLRPGAFHSFWNGSLADLQDKVIDVNQVFPVDERFTNHLLSLEDEAAIQYLLEMLRIRKPQTDSNIELINEIIIASETNENLQTVAAMAKAFGKSERWLQQLFRDYIGVGLKWVLQRHKLLAAARQIRESSHQPNWAAIAYDIGYSSQQHFNAEFKQVLGKTPRQYKKELFETRDSQV